MISRLKAGPISVRIFSTLKKSVNFSSRPVPIHFDVNVLVNLQGNTYIMMIYHLLFNNILPKPLTIIIVSTDTINSNK